MGYMGIQDVHIVCPLIKRWTIKGKFLMQWKLIPIGTGLNLLNGIKIGEKVVL